MSQAQIDDAPVVKLINTILTEAVKRGASTPHRALRARSGSASCESRFNSIEELRLPRMPVTITSSSSAAVSAEQAGSATAVPRIKEIARATLLPWNARSLTTHTPVSIRCQFIVALAVRQIDQ